MKTFQVVLALALMVPGWAILAALVRKNAGADPLPDYFVGGVIGLFFGLMFGGVRGKWLDAICGPEQVQKEPRTPAFGAGAR